MEKTKEETIRKVSIENDIDSRHFTYFGVEKCVDEYGKDLLQKYSMWLTKNGYMDTDWKDEEPYAIDEFLKTLK